MQDIASSAFVGADDLDGEFHEKNSPLVLHKQVVGADFVPPSRGVAAPRGRNFLIRLAVIRAEEGLSKILGFAEVGRFAGSDHLLCFSNWL